MRSRYKIHENDQAHFLTATIVEWIPVFTCSESCQIIVDALEYARQHKGLRIYAFVILDNHIHLVADAPDLRRTIQTFKRHTANEILALADRTQKDWLLNQFAYYKKRHRAASNHQVWQEGVHPQLIQGDAMLYQKIEYIHDNPVRRGLVDTPEHWRYSSARNYTLGDDSVLVLDEWLR